MAGKTIAYLNVLLGASNRQLFAALDSSEKRVRRFGQDLEKTGKDLSMKVTAPLAALGYISIQSAATFSDSMLKVKALSGATGEDFEKLEKQALKLGQTTRYSASEVAEGMGYMALAGFNTNQTLQATPAILALAAAAQTDLASTSDIVTDTMAAFSMEAGRAMEVSDLFAQTQAKSNTSVLQLGEAFKYSAANAASSNQSITDTASILSVLANAGLKGSSAGTALNAMLRDMKKASDDGNLSIGNTAIALYDSNGAMRSAVDILSDVEKATGSMTQAQRDSALMAIFKEESIRGVNTILNQGTDELKRYQKLLDEATGAAKRMSDEMESGLGGSLRTLKSNLEGVAIIIGNNLAPMIDSLAEVVASLSTWLSELNPTTQKVIVGFGVFAAAIPPIILGLGAMLTMGTAMIAKFKLITLSVGISSTALAAFGASLSAAIWPITGIIAGLYGLGKAYTYFNSQSKINLRTTAEVSQRLKYLSTIKQGAEKISNDLANATKNLSDMTKEERLEIIETTKARLLDLQTSLQQEKALLSLTAKKAMELTLLEKMKAGMLSFGNSALYGYNMAQTQAQKYAEATKEGSKSITEQEEFIKQLTETLENLIAQSDSLSNLNKNLNTTDNVSEKVKKSFEDLTLELKKIGILSDIIGKSYDNIEARVRAFTQAMLDLRVNGIEKTSSAYKELEASRNKALDFTQAVELSKKLQELTNRSYVIKLDIKTVGGKIEKFDSSLLGLDLNTFNEVANKTGEAIFNSNMKIAGKQKQAFDKIKADKQNFNDSYRQLQESFIIDIAGDLVSGLGGLLVQGKDGFGQFFSSILSNFGRFLVQMGKMGLVYSGFAAKLKTAMLDPAGGAAAALAMIAIGGAMSAAASRVNTTVGSGTRSSGAGSTYNQSFFNQRGLESSNEVEFIIKGDRLVGVLGRNSRFKNRF